MPRRDAGFQEDETFEGASVTILQFAAGGVESFLHRNRHPELKRNSDEGSVKVFRSDANDCVLQAVQILRLSDDLRVALVTVLPRLMADHGHGMSVASHAFFRRERATQRRTHAECFKIVRCHEAADRALGPISDAQGRRDQLVDDERLNERAVLLKINAIGIGKLIETGGAAGCSGEDEHPLLVGDGRIGMKENSFDPTKDGRGGANPKGQANNGE